ncbi:MAG: 7TM diverse intracellular signaling domain-containing protein [Ketobacteraceae bacterium]|nr:7TM diverse intracellular signaling domain-containing protein [Ketobacteraceae bacterium]
MLPVSLTPYLSVYEDRQGAAGLPDILGELSDRFVSLHGKALNSGLSGSVYWVRAELPGGVVSTLARTDPRWLVEFATPYLNHLDLYVIDTASGRVIKEWQTGDLKPFSARPIPSVNFSFPLDLEQGRQLTLLARLANDGLVIANPRLWPRDQYAGVADARGKLYGLFYGAMIIMALYNLVIFLAIRDLSYLYYVLSILGITLFEACNRGDAFKYLWPDSPALANIMLPQSIFFAEIFTLLFVNRFLQLPQHMPLWSRIIKGMVLVAVLMMIAGPFIANRHAVNMASILAMLLSLVAAYVGIVRASMGSRSARFFILAWGILLVSVFVTALMRFIPIPVNAFTSNLISVGLSIEVTLLSLALADRFNRIQKQTKRTLQDALRKLEKSNLVKDQFLSTISHELRTPMNGIEGALTLIHRENLSDVDQLYLNTAISSARDMTGMIDTVLRFNEMQAGSIVLKSEPFNPVTFFNGISLEIEERCRRKNIRYEADIPGSAMVLKGDPEQIRLVLIQLADNAVKYTPPQGQVNLKVFQTVDSGWASLVIRVEDTGVGISEDIQEKLFQPFSAARSQRTATGGLGIGLTLSRYLVQKMGGTFTLDSSPEKGTRAEVVLHLPILAQRVEEVPEVSLPGAQRNILVVEDNPVNQQVLKGILSRLGYHSFYADNGLEALELLRQESIDLVFMDCQMPVMDGYEATEKIRHELGLTDLPIIAVTANAMSTDKEKCMRAGMDDYLAKPIQIDHIRKMLARWS